MPRSNRTTIAEVRSLAEHVADELKRVGIIPKDSTVTLQTGSPTYGRAWRLFYSPSGTTGLHTIPHPLLNAGWPGGGYLGWSKSEAADRLRDVAYTLTDEYRDLVARERRGEAS